MTAVLGKVEGEGKKWHGHVTAVTVCPTYRRQGIAHKLMDFLEEVTKNRYVPSRKIGCSLVHCEE